MIVSTTASRRVRRMVLAAAMAGLVGGTIATAGWGDTVDAMAVRDGNWSDAGVWSTDPLVPNNGNGGHQFDVAVYDNYVTVDMNATVGNLRLMPSWDGGITLEASRRITVLENLEAWGRIAGPGAVDVNGELYMDGATLDGVTLNHGGTTNWAIEATGVNGAVLNNLATGMLDVKAMTVWSGAVPVLNNAGLLRAGGSQINWILNNSGTVEVKNGSLTLGGGGTSSGAFTLEDATLKFYGGTHELGTTSAVSGNGVVEVYTPGKVRFGGQYDVTKTTIESPPEGWAVVEFDGEAKTGTLSMLAATLGGTGTLTVTRQASVEEATLQGSGRMVSMEQLEFSGWTHLDGYTIVNAASAGFASFGPVTLLGSNGAVFSNEEMGTFLVQKNGVLSKGAGASPAFNNAGMFVVESPGREFTVEWMLNNSGLVEVNLGTLGLRGGGTSTGEFNVAAGAYLVFEDGAHVLGPTSNVHGDGIVKFEGGTVDVGGQYRVVGTTYISGGRVNVNSSMGPIMMVFSGGTVAGNGSIVPLGQMVWMGGTFTGNGRVISPLLLSISRADAKMIDGWTITNSGKAVWWNGTKVSAQNGAAFNNAGDFEAMGDGEFTFTGVGAAARFDNSGRFVKSAGVGAMKFAGVTFNNTGVVQVKSGRLELMGPVTQFMGGTLTGGEWDVHDGAALVFPTSGAGVVRNQGKVTLRGPGSVFGPMNALAENEGTFAVVEGRSFTTAAGLRNSGMLMIGADSEVVVNGQFVNTGIVQSMGSLIAGSGAGAAARAGLRVEGDLTNMGVMSLNGGLEMVGDVMNHGTLGIGGPVSWRDDAVLRVDGGKLVMSSDAGSDGSARLRVEVLGGGEGLLDSEQHLKGLKVEVGSVAITRGGRKTLRTEGLELGLGGRLDLGEHDLIVQASAQTRMGVYEDLMEWVRAGRKAGAGVTSSASGRYRALGLALNERAGGGLLTGTFGGQLVDGNCVLVKYTWEGDANLDGVVNADDYFQIDSGFIARKTGWFDGDFNYDGVINADDYFLIDSAFMGQSGPLAMGRVAAVPEGSGLAMMVVAILGMMGQGRVVRRSRCLCRRR